MKTLEYTVPFAGMLAGISLLASLGGPASAAPERQPSISRLGSISGVVTDSHGDAIPGARVSVISEDGAIVSESTSGAGGESTALGEFHIDRLPRGMYSVRATLDESKASAGISRIAVSAWEDTRVRIALDLGY